VVCGGRYEGLWVDDNMHGSGVLQKVEGGKYKGQFWNGMKHGVGTEVGLASSGHYTNLSSRSRDCE
jgi:hypothetical protein